MNIDTFEGQIFGGEELDTFSKINEIGKGFESSSKSIDGVYKNENFSIMNTRVPTWLGLENKAISELPMESVSRNIKQMYEGTELSNGKTSLGLKEIGTWKVTDYSSIKSHAGYAAEVISTTKENLINESQGNGIRTYRADDLPELFQKNDQYVDKVRMDANNNIVERVQTKFVGRDGADCVKTLCGKDYDKYFNDGKVDKLEIPKDYLKDAKKEISRRIDNTKKQIDSATERGDSETLSKRQADLDRLNKMDEMLEQSNTTSTEAIQAAKHPKAYAAKQVAKRGVSDGLDQSVNAMIITGAISTVDNVSKYIEGEISPEDAVKNIAKDTGTAGAAAFGVGFITSSTATLMRSSSNKLIRDIGSAGGGCLPAAAVSYGIEVHGAVVDYAKGNIDNTEFVDELGRSGAKVAGGMVGGAVGSVAGPVGSFAGASVGSAVAETAYDATKYVTDTVVDLATGETDIEEVAEEIKDSAIDKAEEIKETTVETVENYKEIAGFVAEKTGLDETADVAKENIEKAVENVADKVDETVDKVKDVVDTKVTEVKEKVDETADKVVESAKDYQQSAKELVSSTVNYAVTSEAYVSVVETCEGAIDSASEELGKLEAKAQEYADKAIEKAGDFGADAVKDVKAAISNFNIKNSLPFKV